MEFHFRRDFRSRPKMKNAFRSTSSMHHKKVLVLVWKKVLITSLSKNFYYFSRLHIGLYRRSTRTAASLDKAKNSRCVTVPNLVAPQSNGKIVYEIQNQVSYTIWPNPCVIKMHEIKSIAKYIYIQSHPYTPFIVLTDLIHGQTQPGRRSWGLGGFDP